MTVAMAFGDSPSYYKTVRGLDQMHRSAYGGGSANTQVNQLQSAWPTMNSQRAVSDLYGAHNNPYAQYLPPVPDAQALVTRKAHGVIQDRGFGGAEARPKSRRYAERNKPPHPTD